MSHPIAYPDLGGRFWYFESGGGRLIWRKAIDLESHAHLIAFLHVELWEGIILADDEVCLQ